MAKAKSNRGTGLLTGLANLTETGVVNENGQSVLESRVEEKSSVISSEPAANPIEDVTPVTIIEPIKEPVQIESLKSPKRAPGRPRKFKKDDNTVVLGIRVLEEEARFLEEYGGKYGGKTGYVTYLIRKEMERLHKA